MMEGHSVTVRTGLQAHLGQAAALRVTVTTPNRVGLSYSSAATQQTTASTVHLILNAVVSSTTQHGGGQMTASWAEQCWVAITTEQSTMPMVPYELGLLACRKTDGWAGSPHSPYSCTVRGRSGWVMDVRKSTKGTCSTAANKSCGRLHAVRYTQANSI